MIPYRMQYAEYMAERTAERHAQQAFKKAKRDRKIEQRIQRHFGDMAPGVMAKIVAKFKSMVGRKGVRRSA